MFNAQILFGHFLARVLSDLSKCFYFFKLIMCQLRQQGYLYTCETQVTQILVIRSRDALEHPIGYFFYF